MKTALLFLVLIASQSFAGSPGVYSRQGKFLGNLNNNQYDPNSVANPYGRYGNPYSADSVNNPYGRYGNPYSNDSVSNPYGTNSPVVIDSDDDY